MIGNALCEGETAHILFVNKTEIRLDIINIEHKLMNMLDPLQGYTTKSKFYQMPEIIKQHFCYIHLYEYMTVNVIVFATYSMWDH